MSALAVPFPTLATRKDSTHPVLLPCSQPGPFSNNPTCHAQSILSHPGSYSFLNYRLKTKALAWPAFSDHPFTIKVRSF